ncbi:hypothetical protein DY000_02023871 [Brassica cretica]|uniref:Reverse transcriptase zinc-binding domain-containing protein n=1 Tax=Brassica cretica TaxID=69181 RepID=A0ABQ7EJ35_BRACR|nr:hypothetical protein DY000_02023871 [Brassica cretica]
MISLRICVEFCAIKGKFSLTLSDLLPKTCGARWLTRRSFLLQSLVMEDSLQLSLKSMKLVDDEEPLTLPDSPRFRVFDENSTSLLGRVESSHRNPPLEGPPGFPPLFPELPPQEQKAVMLYISHADATERQARIMRVRQAISDQGQTHVATLTKFTANLEKGKGHVYSYPEDTQTMQTLKKPRPALSLPLICDESSDSALSGVVGSQELAVTTGFQIGLSSKTPSSGDSITPKQQRRRPPSWKRKAQASKGASPSNRISKSSAPQLESSGKRKTDEISIQGSVVDLTLRVEDLLIPGTGVWNQELLYRTFSPKDAEIIMQIKPEIAQTDSVVWGLSKNGLYTSKSGYALMEIIEEINTPQVESIPPVEKKLWSSLWKTKTTPKLRHFLWRILSGALAVKERLRSRGIQLNVTCSSCNNGGEDIGHVLFHCPFAKEVWSLSSIPMPPSGVWSRSVFLNLLHLINCGKRRSQAPETGLVFPWILWQIWKARNAFCFEHIRLDPVVVLDKALVEAEVWRELQAPAAQRSSQVLVAQDARQWKRPPTGWVKCNFASSWLDPTSVCGGAWIVRDSYGKVIFHSRRSLPPLPNPVEADLLSLLWTLEDMANLRVDKAIFESSSPYLREAFLVNPAPASRKCIEIDQIQSIVGTRLLYATSSVYDNDFGNFPRLMYFNFSE